MEPQSIRKTYKYKLKPTTEQERALDRTLMLCRHVYNAAIGERREAWQRCGVSVGYYQQKAELPGIKAGLPEYSEVNSQVLQDVVQRVDRAFQAFFRRARVRGGRSITRARVATGIPYRAATASSAAYGSPALARWMTAV